MPADEIRNWLDFLKPEVTRPRLIRVAVFIACFESLKDFVVSAPRNFFLAGNQPPEPHSRRKYEAEVLSRHKSQVRASLSWFREMGALDEDDLNSFDRTRQCRNLLAHELLSIVASQGPPADLNERLVELVALHRKLARWWTIEIDIPISCPEHLDDIDEKDVVSGRELALQVLLDVALGDDATSRAYDEEVTRRWPNGPPHRNEE